MRKLIIIIPLVLSVCYLNAQDNQTETEIRNLEQMEVKAVLAKDTVSLKKIWDKNYVVHNPENKIVLAVANSTSRPVLNRPRTSFTREVEHILVKGDVVISMGNETVVAPAELPNSDKTIKRRYTNIWMKVDNAWKLVARHANIVRAQK